MRSSCTHFGRAQDEFCCGKRIHTNTIQNTNTSVSEIENFAPASTAAHQYHRYTIGAQFTEKNPETLKISVSQLSF